MGIKYWLSRLHLTGKEEVTHLVSFPKSGRTWLQLLIGTYLVRYFQLDGSKYNPLRDLHEMTQSIDRVSSLQVTHDGSVFYRSPTALDADKQKYANANVILLIRDPRDVVVSAYFERNRRFPGRGKKGYEGTLTEFLRHDQGSFDTIVAFYNIWYQSKEIPKQLKIVKYEHLLNQTEYELWAILKFMRLPPIDDSLLKQAVQECSFDNMREMERTDKFADIKLKPGDASDAESYKTRKGKIGGYKDYLSAEDIDYVDFRMRENLAEFFGYH